MARAGSAFNSATIGRGRRCQRIDVLMQAILGDLRALGRYGEPVPNLHDTAVAGAGIVPGGEVVKWCGDHSNDRDEAIARYRREEGGPAGGPIP